MQPAPSIAVANDALARVAADYPDFTPRATAYAVFVYAGHLLVAQYDTAAGRYVVGGP